MGSKPHYPPPPPEALKGRPKSKTSIQIIEDLEKEIALRDGVLQNYRTAYSELNKECAQWQERALIAEDAPWNVGRISVDHKMWLDQKEQTILLKFFILFLLTTVILESVLLVSHMVTCHAP